MAKKRYTAETIIHKLRAVEILEGQGKTVAQAVKHIALPNKLSTVGARHMAACE